jgi:hypothetical protein
LQKKKIAIKKIETKFHRKTHMEDEIVKKNNLKKWLQIKQIAIKRMETRFERLKVVRGEIKKQL